MGDRWGRNEERRWWVAQATLTSTAGELEEMVVVAGDSCREGTEGWDWREGEVWWLVAVVVDLVAVESSVL